MSILFESILLFSLAVLIIIMGGLVYYFKKRIVEVEQNNATCLEVVQDVYLKHTKLQNEVNGLRSTMQYQYQYHDPSQHDPSHHDPSQHVKTNDELIKIVLSEDDSESEDKDINEIDDSESEDKDINEIDDSDSEDKDINEIDDSDSDSDSVNDEVNNMKNEDKIKIVNVDMSFPEEFEINIDEDLDGEDLDGEEDSELKSLKQPDHQVVVNKVDTTTHISKTELKKLTPSALKNLLIEKGVNTEQVAKMKKNELIDKLAVM